MTDTIRDVLLLVADQWRGDALGHLGTPGVLTPNLDALAADGVSFTNHWCQASPCGPSRRSLLTGTEPTVHGQWTNDEVGIGTLPTLAELAGAAGLRPMLIGYTDTPSPTWDPANRWPGGKHLTEEGVGAALHDPAFELVRPFFWQLSFPAYRAYLAANRLGPPIDDMMGIYPLAAAPCSDGLAPSSIPAQHSDTAWLTDAAIDLIDQSTEPMLLHLNWLRPHPPFAPPEPYHRMVDPDSVSIPDRPNRLEDQCRHPFFGAAADRPLTEYLQRPVRVEALTETDDRHLRAGYYGLCAEVDYHLGRVIDQLKTTGRWDSTLVIFLSDHGEALGDQWLYGRRGPFDGHFRVPCVIRDPRPKADAGRGTQVNRFTTNGDVLPTILEAIGGEVPHTAGGRSLTGLLNGDQSTTAGWRRHVRYAMDWSDHARPVGAGRGPGRQRFTAVRTERYRYVDFGELPPMLFDLEEDPSETVNRADDPALSTVQEELHHTAHLPE